MNITKEVEIIDIVSVVVVLNVVVTVFVVVTGNVVVTVLVVVTGTVTGIREVTVTGTIILSIWQRWVVQNQYSLFPLLQVFD